MDNDQIKREHDNKLVPFEDVELCLGDPAFFHDLFPEEGGPGHLLMFLDAVRSGLYPPIETIDWLFVAFQKFSASDGEKSIEDLLGLNFGPGKSSFFKNKRKIAIKEKIASDVENIHNLGLSVSKACEAVAEKASAGGYIELTEDEISITGRTIRNYYNSISMGKVSCASKEKPFIFFVEMLLKGRSITTMTVPTSDPTGAYVRERIRMMSEGFSAVTVYSQAEYGLKILKSFPEPTQLWVEREIK